MVAPFMMPARSAALMPRSTCACKCAKCSDRHVVGGLHERDLGRRFDHPAGANQLIARDDLVFLGRISDAIDDEKAHGGLDRHRAGAHSAIAQTLYDSQEGALVQQ